MTVTERVAYVRGLFEGLEINVDKKEGRLFKEIIALLEDMALSITDLEEENEALQGVLDAMIEDLYDEDDSYDEEEITADGMGYDPDNELFEVVCPSCGEEIFIDEATLEQGNISCPACGEELEFDMSSLEEDEPAFSDIPEEDDPEEDYPADDFPEVEFDTIDEPDEDEEDEEDEDNDDD
ncbi:MAG: CD1247 N-terminal domain-containing protein [Butyricicoccus sp.]